MADEKTQATAPQAEANTQAEAPAAAELTVQDLTAIKQIIDVASSRGAFKANEMAVVGTTYNKLESFLGAVQAQQEPKEEPKGE
jgi:D-alanyl-D-alanine carboxypeptidase